MGEPFVPGWRKTAQRIVLIMAYLSLNTTLNLINRWALGIYGFSFPILLTMCHMAFSFTVLLPVMVCISAKGQLKATFQRQWKGITCIGCLMAMNIGLNNLSLVYLPLSLNQVVRAALPVVTAVMGVFIERKVPSQGESMSLTMLVTGVIIAIFEGKAAGNTHGITLCVTGTLCSAAMMAVSSRVLSEKIDALQLTFYTTPISCMFLLPFFLLRELVPLRQYAGHNWHAVAAIMVGGSAVALAYNLVHYLLIQKTSAVTVTVLGEVKIVGLLVLSAMLLPGESKAFTLNMTVGCIMAMAGFCLYSNVRLLASRQRGSSNDLQNPKSIRTAMQDGKDQGLQEGGPEDGEKGGRMATLLGGHKLGGDTPSSAMSATGRDLVRAFNHISQRLGSSANSTPRHADELGLTLGTPTVIVHAGGGAGAMFALAHSGEANKGHDGPRNP